MPDKNKIKWAIYEKGGKIKKTPVKVDITSTNNEDPGSRYSPVEDRIYFNPKDDVTNPNAVYQHERFHKYQHDKGWDTLPDLYEGPLRKPSMADNPDGQQSIAYYNKGNEDVNFMQDWFLKRNPSFNLINEDLLYDKQVQPSLYQNPNTLEGGARAYENYIRSGGKPMFHNLNKMYKYQDGGNIPAIRDNTRTSIYPFSHGLLNNEYPRIPQGKEVVDQTLLPMLQFGFESGVRGNPNIGREIPFEHNIPADLPASKARAIRKILFDHQTKQDLARANNLQLLDSYNIKPSNPYLKVNTETKSRLDMEQIDPFFQDRRGPKSMVNIETPLIDKRGKVPNEEFLLPYPAKNKLGGLVWSIKD